MTAEKVENLVFSGLGLFRSRAGAVHREGFFPDHRHDAVEILMPQGLQGQAYTPTERLPFKDGYALVIPANLVHATWTVPVGRESGLRFIQLSAARLLAMARQFSPDILNDKDLGWLLHGNSALDLNLDLIRTEVEALFALGTPQGRGAAGTLFAAFSLVHRLLDAARERAGIAGGKAPALRSAQTEEIIAFLERNHAEPLQLSVLAQRFGCSPHHLCRQFKRRTGKTLGDYLRYLRVSRAMNLIMDGAERMGDVGHAVGFNDLNHFARCFRAVTGETPKRFQKRAASGARGPAPSVG
ncbi:MAG: helix-turn-helix transcriptional regulator [Spirochaetes bacterium]|nr:helix-turn-helix transcriptional regulator [Spirochaetota bacterium]